MRGPCRPPLAHANASSEATTRPRGGPRMAVPFRVYPAPHDHDEPLSEPLVHIRFGDLLPLVALAMKQNYLWLHDFLDDEVALTSDLYDVLRTFRSYRPSA